MATDSPADHVEKCGYLKIKRPPTSGKVRLKAWQSKYFVLRDPPPVFEYFKDELSYHTTRSHKEKNRISLENVIHIGTTDASKTQRNAFMIVDSHHGALLLASDSEQDTKEWVEALNRVAAKTMSPPECTELGSLVYPDQSPPLPTRRSMSNTSPLGSPVLGIDSGLRRASAPPIGEGNNKGFLVTTRLTPSSEKNGIRDKYRMHITDEHVVLHRLDSNTPVISWPIIGLRGWKSEPAEIAGRRGTRLLTLESGRKSATGEGLFQFFTNFGDQIAAKIRAQSNVLYASAVRKREKFKLDRSNSFEDIAHSCSGEETIKKTEPPPYSSQKHTPTGSSQKSTLTSRAESDSLLHFEKIECSKLSPASLRKELLQGICAKDLSSKEKEEYEWPPEKEADVFTAVSTDNAYLDLIAESGVEPVHISDPEHRRTSTNSEEGAPILKCQIPSINESKEQSDYIDESEINIYTTREKKVNSIDGTGCQCQDYGDNTRTQASTASADTQFCQEFFDQLSNPTAHKTSIFSQCQSQTTSSHHMSNSTRQELTKRQTKVLSTDVILTSEDLIEKQGHVINDASKSVFTRQGEPNNVTGVTNQSIEESADDNDPLESLKEECLSPSDIEFDDESVDQSHFVLEPQERGNLHKLLKRSDETQDLLQRCLFQLESPQTFAQQDLFPHFSKRNSTGNVTNDKMSLKRASESKLKAKSLTLSSEFGTKKTIEKSQSHCGFDNKLPTDKAPPLPARKDIIGHARARNSASMGDIFEDMKRRPDQFLKGINRQLSPIGTHTPAFGASCGPESLVTARLLQRTTSGSNLVLEKRSATHLSIHDSQNEVKSSINEQNRPRASSLRSSRDSSSQSAEDDRSVDNEGDCSKGRRGSKASKFLNKVLNNFSLSPVTTTKRRASCDCLSPDSLKDVEVRARSGSAVNSGIDNEGWSPETSLDVPTPEGSPKTFRKSSSALRRASHDPSLGRKTFFVGSPTFDNRNEELKQKARERERERAELPHQPPPALPPRKKSDPPPLPPRRRKSSGDHSCPSSPPSRTTSQEHSQSSAIKTTSSLGVGSSYDDQLTSPPPIPPRRDERRGSHPPSIQLTASSPENKTSDDSHHALPEEPLSSSTTEDASEFGGDSTEVPVAVGLLPTISSFRNMDTDVSCPVPQRPPKNKGNWTRQLPIDLLDSASVVEEMFGVSQSCEATSKLKVQSSFVSIEIQERIEEFQQRLEVSEIELDSLINVKNVSTNVVQSESSKEIQFSTTTSSRAEATDSLTPPLYPAGSGLGSKGNTGRCSPAGHSSPRGSSLVLGDSGSTTPISV